MGVDTRAYIPNLTPQKLLDFMRVFNKDAELERAPLYPKEMHYINFGERQMTIHKVDLDMTKVKEKADKEGWHIKNTDEYLHIKEDGWPANTQGISVRLASNNEAHRIIKLICFMFGGYFKAEDTSGGQYTEIKSDKHKVIVGVFNDT